MVQSGNKQVQAVPAEVCVGIDFGTTTSGAAVSEMVDPTNPGDVGDYALEFESSEDANRSKTTKELDTTMVFSSDGRDCFFGPDGLTISGGHFFIDWKIGAMGVGDHGRRLANTCRALEESAPQMKPFTPAALFRRLLMHILSTTRKHLHRKYGVQFDAIKCYLTYPVSCSESLRLLLLQEASAAGWDVMGAVSESMAIAHALHKEPSLPPGARLILDFGGSTVDAAAVYVNDDGEIAQACPTDGHMGGGQTINEWLRNWLQEEYPDWHALCDDRQWTLGGISSQIDRCKRAFNGHLDQEICGGTGQIVPIPAAIMKLFYQKLIDGVAGLTQKMCDRAKDAGRPIIAVVVCGGLIRNQFFLTEFFNTIRANHPDISTFESFQEPGIVARGALCYSRNPVVERCAITRGVGLSYIGDYGRNGRKRKRGGSWMGIGWILREGQEPDKLPGHIRFTKTIRRGSEELGDCLIESKVYAGPVGVGSETFARDNIMQNNLIEWNCDITYPATNKVLSQLSHLGTFSGILPHDELFPTGTETRETKFEFQLTLEVYRQLLRGVFRVRLKDGRWIALKDVRYTPLPLRPWSEYQNQKLSTKGGGAERAEVEGSQPACERQDPPPSALPATPSPTGRRDLAIADGPSLRGSADHLLRSISTVHARTGSNDFASTLDTNPGLASSSGKFQQDLNLDQYYQYYQLQGSQERHQYWVGGGL